MNTGTRENGSKLFGLGETSSPKWVRYCVDDGYLWVYYWRRDSTHIKIASILAPLHSLQEGENPRQAESAKFGEVQKIETGDGTLQC
jgi:hypothetical protein